MHTENTNFALLVAKHFSEPFHDSSNGYGGGASPAFPICSAAGSSSALPATSCAAEQHGQAHRRGLVTDPRGDRRAI